MPRESEFGIALFQARFALHLTQPQVAARVGKGLTAVHRWEKQGVVPHLEDRIRVVRALAQAPPAMLKRLADASGVSLESLGLAPRPAPAPPPPVLQPPSLSPPTALDPSAQTIVDDALREAAEEIDASPKTLRPALSRMLDRIAKAGVPIDAAARMVLGVPKKDAKDAKAPAPKPA
jgi:transcriptional regulator with XRE-family HTH domain